MITSRVVGKAGRIVAAAALVAAGVIVHGTTEASAAGYTVNWSPNSSLYAWGWAYRGTTCASGGIKMGAGANLAVSGVTRIESFITYTSFNGHMIAPNVCYAIHSDGTWIGYNPAAPSQTS